MNVRKEKKPLLYIQQPRMIDVGSNMQVPLVMHKLKVDPAVASGPFITTINDIISILIYFGLATIFMSYLL